MSDIAAEQDQVERDLQRTRVRMDGRLDELQRKLSPGQVLDDLMTYFRGSEGDVAATNLWQSVRDNPLPTVFTGVGLAWLIVASTRPPADTRLFRHRSVGMDPRRANSHDPLHALREAEERITRHAEEAEAPYQERLEETRGKALGVVRDVQETAASFAQRVRDAVEKVTDTVSEASTSAAGGVADTVSHLGDQAASFGAGVREATGTARDKLADSATTLRTMGGNLAETLKESPIALGAIGLAAGALLAALLPQSETEDDLLGDAADRTRKVAGDLAGDAFGKSSKAVGELAEEALDRASKIASEVLDAGSQVAGGAAKHIQPPPQPAP